MRLEEFTLRWMPKARRTHCVWISPPPSLHMGRVLWSRREHVRRVLTQTSGLALVPVQYGILARILFHLHLRSWFVVEPCNPTSVAQRETMRSIYSPTQASTSIQPFPAVRH